MPRYRSADPILSDVARRLAGRLVDRWYLLRAHPDVVGRLDDVPISLAFPSGGEPWRVQNKRMRVRLTTPPRRVRRPELRHDLLTAGVPPAWFEARIASLAHAWCDGSDLVIGRGRASIELVLPQVIHRSTPEQILGPVLQFGELVAEIGRAQRAT